MNSSSQVSIQMGKRIGRIVLAGVGCIFLLGSIGVAGCEVTPSVDKNLNDAHPRLSTRDKGGDRKHAETTIPAHLLAGYQYVHNAAFRRRTLETSLVNHQNGYARIRLENYTEDKWGSLKILRPRYRPIRPGDLGKGVPKADNTWQRLDTENTRWTDASLRQLGEAMFTGYPAQLERSIYNVLNDSENPRQYGLWQTAESVGGLIWVELPGGVYPSLTCATCHATANEKGKLIYGLPNHNIDIGKMQDDARSQRTLKSHWGPGRVDISPDRLDNPIVIPDLRAVAFEKYLHRTANVKNSPEALAVRLETGLILVSNRSVRPPRVAIFALSHFVTGLGKTLPPIPESEGRVVFNAHCATCHNGVALSGAPVPVDDLHDDSAIANSPIRTTGFMQNTSLRGVSGRRRLLSNGMVEGFEDLLRADRAAYGHYFGQNLLSDEKQKLIAFLKQL